MGGIAMKVSFEATRTHLADLTFAATVDRLYALAKEGPLALLVHARPDGDCIGSAFAMSALLSELGCKTRIVCSDKLPERLKFIGEGIQEDILPESATGVFAAGGRAVSLDVASPAQLGELEGKYNILLAIDHHASSTQFADRYLDSGAAATGEIVWRLAREWVRRGYISEIPHRTAFAAYAAISSDTGCFKYSNVTAATHRAAAQLVSAVPEHADIDRLLFDTKTPSRLAAERSALEVLRLCEGGRIAVCPMSKKQIAENGLEPEELDALIDVARSVAGVEVAFSIREEGEGKYRVSSRSNSAANVSELCAAFGGGGHLKAAGCTIEAGGLEEAVSVIVSAAKRLIS